MSHSAPPPPSSPPPPPQTPTPLQTLPTELILATMSHMRETDLINFVLAAYPHLLRLGLAPALSCATLRRLTSLWPAQNTPSVCDRLPLELKFQIRRYLRPEDWIAYVFADAALFHSLVGWPSFRSLDQYVGLGLG